MQIPARTDAGACPPLVQVRTHAASDYFPAFDWLRAALAVAVMLSHDSLLQWGKAGGLAVHVFFVLSGWLIGGILLDTRRTGLGRFYFNRAVRIWAPYYVALALLVAASLLKDAPGTKWLEFVLYKLLMVWNLFGSAQLADFRAAMPLHGTGNHFWSVNAEEQFYLVCPLLLVLAPGWGRSLLVWAGLALAGFATQNLYTGIVLGVLAAIAASRFGNFHATRPAQAALVVALVLSAWQLSHGGTLEAFAPVFGLAVVLLLARPGQPTRLGRVAGGMSYPLYLNHWIGLFVGNALFAPFGLRDSVARLVFASVFSVGFAVVLYLYIDRPLLARRDRWYTQVLGNRTRAVAYGMVGVGIAFGMATMALR